MSNGGGKQSTTMDSGVRGLVGILVGYSAPMGTKGKNEVKHGQ